MAKGIPYGISDFSRLIDQNYGGSNQENTIRDDGLRVYHP